MSPVVDVPEYHRSAPEHVSQDRAEKEERGGGEEVEGGGGWGVNGEGVEREEDVLLRFAVRVPALGFRTLVLGVCGEEGRGEVGGVFVYLW